MALNSLLQSNALTPMQTIQTTIELYSSYQREQRLVEDRVEKAQEYFRQRSTNRLRQYRNAATIFGVLSAAALFFGQELPNYISPQIFEVTYRWPLWCFVIAVYTGLIAWFLSFQINRVEQKLRDLEEQTGTKTLLYRFLQGIIGKKLHDSWTLEQMADDIDEWVEKSNSYGHVIRTIGSIQFAQFLIDRANQLNLILIRDELVQGQLVEYYTISLNLDHDTSS